jgi:hypothetical protein
MLNKLYDISVIKFELSISTGFGTTSRWKLLCATSVRDTPALSLLSHPNVSPILLSFRFTVAPFVENYVYTQIQLQRRGATDAAGIVLRGLREQAEAEAENHGFRDDETFIRVWAEAVRQEAAGGSELAVVTDGGASGRERGGGDNAPAVLRHTPVQAQANSSSNAANVYQPRCRTIHDPFDSADPREQMRAMAEHARKSRKRELKKAHDNRKKHREERERKDEEDKDQGALR